MLDASPGAIVLCEPAQSKCTRTCHKSHFARKFTGETPDAPPAAIVLREPAQSKCTWTCHKSHFVHRGNAGRVARGHRFVRACTVEMHMDISQELFCAEIYRGNTEP